ncbi:MAG: glycosyltransferase family 2 protein [Actinomycetes bacterium]
MAHRSMTKQKLASVSFVMPVLNEETYLRYAVESILTQDFDGPVEVILALGPSTDDTNRIAAALVKEHESKHNVVTVENEAGNTSAGLNAAIRVAKHDVIIRVDAHSKLSKNYTKLAVEILNDTQAANVGGIMRAVGHSAFQQAVAFAYTSRVGLGGGAYHVGGEAGPADSVYLGVFRKQALLDVGLFDEGIVRGQDWELNLRLRESGNVVWFDPRLEVEYHPRSDLKRLSKQFFDTGVWRGQLTRQKPGKASLRYFAPPVLVVGSAACLLSIDYGFVLGEPSLTLAVIPLAAYFGLIFFSAFKAEKLNWATRSNLMLVLPAMHYSWGAGFILGFLRRVRQSAKAA